MAVTTATVGAVKNSYFNMIFSILHHTVQRVTSWNYGFSSLQSPMLIAELVQQMGMKANAIGQVRSTNTMLLYQMDINRTGK